MISRTGAAHRALRLVCTLFLGMALACGGGGTSGGSGPTQPTTPSITAPPLPQTVTEGNAATLSVTATGNGTLTYQWTKGGTALAGKTSSSLAFTPVALADAGSYSVTVTNTLNGASVHATTAPVQLTVETKAMAPVIDAQPASTRVTATRSSTLSVTAHVTDGGVLSYQWRKDGLALAGKVAKSLTLDPVQLSDGGSYSVVVTNALHGTTASATSDAATLTVDPAAAPPAISASPADATVPEGGAATFSVTATSPDSGALSYQWRKGATSLPGKVAASLNLASVTPADAGSYSVVVTNTLNGTTASATSAAAVLTVTPTDLRIAAQPQGATVTTPDGLTFSVTAVGGTPPYAYQWKKNGTAVGADSNTYTVSATDLRETNSAYSVEVTDAVHATATSENATLTVMAPKPVYAGDPVPTQAGRTLTSLPSFQTDAAFPDGSFRFGYDEALKNPAWTAYANFKFITAISFVDNDPFKEDTRLALPRVGDGDYSGSGWTRGHNVMQSDIGYRYGQKAADDSCRMSNIAPQIADLNNNFWNNLEQAVGGKTPSAWVPGLADRFRRIWIYTGPTFSLTPATFSSKNIAIPNGFYKIVVYEPTAGQPKALAILAPHQITNNTSPTATALPVADIWKYVTSVARVEQLTGLNFFPTPAAELPGAFKTDVDVLGLGAPFEQTGKPNVHMIEPSWNLSVSAGTTLTFVGAASSATGTVSNPTWTFGSEGTATGLTANHTFNAAGTVNVSFTVTDGASVPNTITRVITVTGGNAAPTISGIGAQSATSTNPVDVSFTVNDDSTPKSSLLVTAASSNQAVLPDTGIVRLSGPDAVTGACTLRLTGTGALGTASVTVSVTDGSSATTTGTFTFTVTDGNSAPFITGLCAKSTPVDTPLTATFNVGDTETSDPGSLQVTAVSSDTALIPGALTVGNSAGACSLVLTPGTGLSGTAIITVTVRDGGGKTTTGTFSLTVGTPATPMLIISQYYEGISSDRWIEVTNVGTVPYDATATPLSLWLWANPYKNVSTWDSTNQSGTYGSQALTGTLDPGKSWLFKNTSKQLPLDSNITGTAIPANNVCTFKDDDIVFLSPVAQAPASGSPTNGPAAYAARTDVIGVNSTAAWMGNNQLVAGTWAAALGMDRSYVRKPTVVAPDATFDLGQWIQVDAAQISSSNHSLADTAPQGDTNRLGEHVYNH